MHRPVKMWGSAVRLTYVLGIRAVRLRRNWPRARRSKSRTLPLHSERLLPKICTHGSVKLARDSCFPS